MQLRQVSLKRFRRFRHFVWYPRPGINCLIGAGDGGKTTILEAIGRATSPAPAGPASEHDYFERRTEDGFEIELLLGALPDRVLGAFHPPMCWGYQGPCKPLLTAPADGSEAVLRLLVRGTPDLEVEHRLIGPSSDEVPFGADKRQLLGLCRVGEMRGSSREFRMARGSLLQRRLGRDEVRGAAARAVRDASVSLDLPGEVREGLQLLGERLRAEGVVTQGVTLELLSPPGQSLLGLLGLAVGEPGRAIPLALAGQGAQRLASYVLATDVADVPPLLLMDEVELGLEPYRQRLLVQRLRALTATGGQAFLTTHSPTVIAELDIDSLQRLHARPANSSNGIPLQENVSCAEATVCQLDESLARVQAADPEALLCRLPVVCEGATEVELLSVLLEGLAMQSGYSLAALGVRLVDGNGQPNAQNVIAALRSAQFQVGAFLDEERLYRGTREALDDDPEVARGLFTSGTCTEFALATTLEESALDELLDVADSAAPRIGDGRRQQLTEALGSTGALVPTSLIARHGLDAVRAALGECAHRHGWFKQRANSRALAHWLIDGRLPAAMASDMGDFWSQLSMLLPVRVGVANAHSAA